jgi:hypothetical protein
VNKKSEFSVGMPFGQVVAMKNKPAYVSSEIFMEWLQNNFTP